MVGTATITAQGTRSQSTRARGGDFYLATSGDLDLATSGDFFMATDIRESAMSGRGFAVAGGAVAEGEHGPVDLPGVTAAAGAAGGAGRARKPSSRKPRCRRQTVGGRRRRGWPAGCECSPGHQGEVLGGEVGAELPLRWARSPGPSLCPHGGRAGGLRASAGRLARPRGTRLRVDCWVGGDGTLVRYYEAAGFTATARFTVGAWEGQVLERPVVSRRTRCR